MQVYDLAIAIFRTWKKVVDPENVAIASGNNMLCSTVSVNSANIYERDGLTYVCDSL